MYKTAYHNEDISKTKFLVTGGAGFIGSNIVEYLLKYNASEVVVLDNYSTGSKRNSDLFVGNARFKFIQGDITNFYDCMRACKGVDYVLHQAALGSVPRSIENPIATNNANVTGFLNVLMAAKECNVKRVVYASSSSVYGDSAELPKREQNIGKPLSPYAVSKLVNEQYADIFSTTYNMEIIGLRYFNIFGPRQSPQGAYAAAIPLFMDSLLKKQSPFLNGDGLQTRDFTFVENAVQANIKALFAPKEALNQVYNIAYSEKISLVDLINYLNDIIGSDIKPIHRADRAGDVRNSLADISKAEKFLDYKPLFSVKDGLKITVDWFKKNF